MPQSGPALLLALARAADSVPLLHVPGDVHRFYAACQCVVDPVSALDDEVSRRRPSEFFELHLHHGGIQRLAGRETELRGAFQHAFPCVLLGR